MLLVIDVGNTHTVFALFDGDVKQKKWRISTEPKRTSDEYFAMLCFDGLAAVDDVVISSVVPQTIFELKQFAKNYCRADFLVIGEDKAETGISVELDHGERVGADRLVNAAYAYHIYGGNVIVIDFGTATTFDVINDKGVYIGGVIAPGINLSMQALHAAAAKLPEVAIRKTDKVLGRSTTSAMQSGIYWGYMGLIGGIVQSLQKELGCSMKVVATGGLAGLFAKDSNVIDSLNEDLTIDGLQYIYNLNKKN